MSSFQYSLPLLWIRLIHRNFSTEVKFQRRRIYMKKRLKKSEGIEEYCGIMGEMV